MAYENRNTREFVSCTDRWLPLPGGPRCWRTSTPSSSSRRRAIDSTRRGRRSCDRRPLRLRQTNPVTVRDVEPTRDGTVIRYLIRRCSGRSCSSSPSRSSPTSCSSSSPPTRRGSSPARARTPETIEQARPPPRHSTSRSTSSTAKFLKPPGHPPVDLGHSFVQPRERQRASSTTPRPSPPRSSSAARSSGCCSRFRSGSSPRYDRGRCIDRASMTFVLIGISAHPSGSG